MAWYIWDSGVDVDGFDGISLVLWWMMKCTERHAKRMRDKWMIRQSKKGMTCEYPHCN